MSTIYATCLEDVMHKRLDGLLQAMAVCFCLLLCLLLKELRCLIKKIVEEFLGILCMMQSR